MAQGPGSGGNSTSRTADCDMDYYSQYGDGQSYSIVDTYFPRITIRCRNYELVDLDFTAGWKVEKWTQTSPGNWEWVEIPFTFFDESDVSPLTLNVESYTTGYLNCFIDGPTTPGT